ncbi:hypothetical protein [uncultured Streptomyces sp.]|uniref:hypothetical protein n=1 Tax=uncultured Streptomyces sp. TaxID=174707 RepID=UPI0026213812|nr:hypothetical protein [uncultured Streptomyces sp.]
MTSDPAVMPDPAATPEPSAAPAIVPAPEQSAPQQSDPARARRLRTAERVLLSLRRARRELHLGEQEARSLAPEAAEWLARGITEDDLRHALLAEHPTDGIRSAVGFLRHRLNRKLPEPRFAPTPPPVFLPRPLRPCTAPGDEHLFRPHADETECPQCRPRPTPPTTWVADDTPDFPPTATWRERFTIVAQQDAAHRE